MLSAIGDAVHTLPVVTALRRAWPETRITWIVQPAAYTLVRGHPAVDDFVVFHRRRGLGAPVALLDLRRELRGRHFDLLLALQVYLKAGLITALAPARVKLGFDRARAADGQWLFTNRRIPPGPPAHVQDQYFEFLRWLGVDPEPVTWGLEPTADERAEAESFFRGRPPVLSVVVGTSRPEKEWHGAGYARVLDEAARRWGLQPVLVGAESPRERATADAIAARVRHPVVDRLGDDLRTLLWMLEGSALVLSPDTGPLHLARAVGTPVVGLFGFTNPKRHGPYRAFADLVVDGYARHPGETYGAERAYRDGMRRVTPEAVIEKVDLAMRLHVPPPADADAPSGGRP